MGHDVEKAFTETLCLISENQECVVLWVRNECVVTQNFS